MKRDKIDEILSVIDTGLQSTGEASYGETPYDGAPIGDPTCVRCARDLDPDAGELCPSCRAFLLGDTDHDPAGTGPHELDTIALHLALQRVDPMGSDLAAFAHAVEELGRALADALRPIADVVLALPEQTRALIFGEREPTDEEIDRLVAALDAERITLETPPGVTLDVGDAVEVEGLPYRVSETFPGGFTATPIADLEPYAVDADEIRQAIVWVEDRIPFEEAIARLRSITRTEGTGRADEHPPEEAPT